MGERGHEAEIIGHPKGWHASCIYGPHSAHHRPSIETGAGPSRPGKKGRRHMELRDEILEKIINRAAELFKRPPAELGAETRFVEDLKAKSVNYVQIIAVLEAEFDVEITFMEFRRRKTLGEAAEFVAGLCGG
jgi:acyl carrier protein